MLHCDFKLAWPQGIRVVEAISHGICEVIERDATTLWKCVMKKDSTRDRLDLEAWTTRFVKRSFGSLSGAGLSVAVWDITSDIEIAAFACFIVPRDDSAMWHCAVAGLWFHPARQVASLRALTEAAQARLTVISGLRDDFRHDAYDQLLDPDQ